MYRRYIGSDPATKAMFDFALCDIVGAWESYEGAPGIRIYRNLVHRKGGYRLEICYNTHAVFHRSIKRYWGNIRYFDLYGFIGLAYDAGHDVLQLSLYGNYHRVEQ